MEILQLFSKILTSSPESLAKAVVACLAEGVGGCLGSKETSGGGCGLLLSKQSSRLGLIVEERPTTTTTSSEPPRGSPKSWGRGGGRAECILAKHGLTFTSLG